MDSATPLDRVQTEYDPEVQLAEQLGLNIRQGELGFVEDCLAQLADGDVDPRVLTLSETLATQTAALQDRLDELEADQQQTHDIATTASGKAETNAARVDELADQANTTRDIAKSAIAKAQQLEADQQEVETASLPNGVEPSSSALDFFANARQSKIKTMFVEESNQQNTYRAIKVAKRWPEFATERANGSGVFLTQDDVTTALTAEIGSKPHRQTVKRVWDKLIELGGDDLVASRRCVGRSQSPTKLLEMDMDTAEGLLEKRYVGLDLLDGTAAKTNTGGVTPVVTGDTDHRP